MKLNRLKIFSGLFFILLLGAGIRFIFLLTPLMDSDQAVNGLMARHITQGALPALYYGQDYCGSIQTYFISTVFFLLGFSRFTLDLTICLESLFFILLIYFLAGLIFDKATAQLSALFTALGSYYLYFHSVLARSAYIEIPILGVLLFVFAYKIIYGQHKMGRYFFSLGLICGLGIWTHYLIVFYFPPIFLLLLIKDKWFWRRGTILFFLTGLILGGLPLWIHNIAYPLISWRYLWEGSGGGESFFASLQDFFFTRLPELLGVINNETQRYNIPYFSFSIYLGYLFLLVFLFWNRRKGLFNLIKWRIDQSTGLDLLLLFVFFFPLIFALSGFAANHTSRYLQPLFSALPILFAVFVRQLNSITSVLAFLFVALTLFSNLQGTLPRIPFLSKNQALQFHEARKADQALFNYLKARNIKRVYCPDYWISVQLTFDAREEIIFAQPIGDRYPLYTELTDRDTRPAFLFPGDNIDFEETLRNIGGSYRKGEVPGFSIYYDFIPPPNRFRALEPSHWKVEASTQAAQAKNIFDQDLSTSWSPSIPPKGEVTFQIDLGKIVSDLGRLTLFSEMAEEVPRNLKVEISSDGRTWQNIGKCTRFWGSLYWSGPHPFFRPGSGRIDMVFPAQAGRYLRITQAGIGAPSRWSVAECTLYQVFPKTESRPDDMAPLISNLKKIPLSVVHTTPWIQAHLSSNQDSKHRTSADLGVEENLISTLAAQSFLVEKEKASNLEDFLKKYFPNPYQQMEIGELVLYLFPPSQNRYRLLANNTWHFQTNYNASKASLAADGKLTTRWTTERAQEPGAFFQIDLGKVEQVARIRVLVGTSRNDFPRGYVIQASADGKTWRPLESLLRPVSLHWTGETLLKGGVDLDFILPPTPMRFLKIIQTGKDEVFYWSIHEIELYQIEGK